MQIDFTFYFGDAIKLNVCADVTLGASHLKELSEDDVAEIVTCVIEDEDTNEIIDFPVAGIYYWLAVENKPIELERAILVRAIVEAANQ